MTAARDHWHLHARRWALVGAPLRPSAEDVAAAERAVAGWVGTAPCDGEAGASGPMARRSGVGAGAPRALILGSTPELAAMRWPAGTTVIAIDRSIAMLHAVFPRGAGTAIAAQWQALPLAAGAVDLVVGDGALCCLRYPDDYRALAAELRRVVAPGGVVALRLFATPEPGEPLAAVGAALAAGSIGSLHALKWRIAMAIATGVPDRSVAVADIARAFDHLVPDRSALPWPSEVVATVDHYRGSDVVYSFPTERETVAALGFDLRAAGSTTPRYELGDRCPTLVFRIRSG